MKDFCKPTLILFFSLALITACDKDDEPAEARLYPHFSCSINGQGFSGKSDGPFGCQPRTFNFYPNGFLSIPPGYMILSGTDCISSKSIGLRFYSFQPTLDTIFMNTPASAADSCSPFHFFIDSISGYAVTVETLVSGFIKFDNFSDKNGDENGLVSGHFGFTVKNEEIDSTVIVTNGQFQYIINYEWY